MKKVGFAGLIAAVPLLIGSPARAEIITYVCNDSGTIRIDTKTRTVRILKHNAQVRLLQVNDERIYYSGLPGLSNVSIDRKTGWTTCDDCDGGDTCRQVK
jgi:hypothetical protein